MLEIHDIGPHGAAVPAPRRVLPAPGRTHIGPVVFIDHLGPVEFAPGSGLDVRPHPHIGLTAVTWLFEGSLLHRDSLGHAQLLEPGSLGWLRAGRGVVHSERSPPAVRGAPHRLHLLQCWIADEAGSADAAPHFRHLAAGEVPRVLAPGIDLRVIAGAGFGRELGLAGAPPGVLGVLRLARLMRFEFLAEFPERAFYVVAGEVAVDGRRCEPGQLAIVGGTRSVLIDAQAPSVLLLIAGAPLGERHLWWNFVAADRARLDAARERWAGGGFEPVPGDAERMPLPAP